MKYMEGIKVIWSQRRCSLSSINGDQRKKRIVELKREKVPNSG